MWYFLKHNNYGRNKLNVIIETENLINAVRSERCVWDTAIKASETRKELVRQVMHERRVEQVCDKFSTSL